METLKRYMASLSPKQKKGIRGKLRDNNQLFAQGYEHRLSDWS